MKQNKSDRREYIKFAAVMTGIVGATALFCRVFNDEHNLEGFLRIFMGVFSITFAVFKLIGYKMFTVMFKGYDVVAKKFDFYAKLFPFLQLAIGLVFLFDLIPGVREYIMLIFAGVSSIGVFHEIHKKRSGKIHCACLGNIIKLPLSTVSFVEDAGMFVLALLMLAL